jgi:SAM-dependent methyltransferase
VSEPTNTGAEFQDEDVVEAYVHRTPYPAELFARLLELTPGRGRLLDLGCGPGQFARALAPHFAEVLAVDPSAAMLRLARCLEGGDRPNIVWRCETAEDVVFEVPLDLIVAGASIHWMDAPVVFPNLAGALRDDGVMAIVGGDGPADAPWIGGWQAAVIAWVERLGGVWNDPAHRARVTGHEPWFDVKGTEVFTAEVTQPVENLIAAEHSRATWTPAKLGALSPAFDAALRAVVTPYAVNAAVTFTTRTTLLWGRPRAVRR